MGAPSILQSVLIVDDDPAIRETLRIFLTDEGYPLLEAADGVACMDTLLLASERLIVLLDLMMPRMTGLDVLSWVASDEELSWRHGYVVMTANIEAMRQADPHLSAWMQPRNIPIIAKPFDIKTVLDVVAQTARCLRAEGVEAGRMPTL
jgi:CheY-like chemotaxis protein